MRLIWSGALLASAALAAAPAAAEERDYCPTRPGLGTTACTISPGRVSVETAIADWTLETDSEMRTDTVLIADTLVRVGVTDALELQAGFTPFGHVRERDKSSGTIERADRVGDLMLGIKANFRNPDGGGFAVGAAPFVTLPVGREPVGKRDWGAGIVVPVSYDLSDAVNLQFSPELDAAVDEDGNGRHLAFSGTVGLEVALNDSVKGIVEFQALRDDDPAEGTTQTLAALSLAWMPSDDLQLDAGANAGLNHATPDLELYFGISRRF